MCNDEGGWQSPKANRSVMMVGGNGSITCMAQEYHRDGDVDGPLRKIGNMGVINVDEWKACYTSERKDDIMV